MNKTKFILTLTEKLAGLPREEIEDRIDFYVEAIDDRMEEGLSEEEAVAAAGPIDEIAAEILSDIPLTRLVVEKVKPKRRLRGWEIVLLCVGAPLWLSLLVAAFAVVLAVYASLWSVIVALWASEVAFLGTVVGTTAAGTALLSIGDVARGICLLGIGAVLAGCSVFLFFGCKAATSGMLLLTKKIALAIKKMFV